MAAFNRVDILSEDLAEKVHDLNADVLKAYLSNAAPSVSLDAVKADLAEITPGNGYTSGGHDTQNATSRASGVTSVTGVDIVITAAGGTVGPFRYVPLYNDTPTAPADPLLGWWDYASAITLQIGESFTIDFGASMLTVG